jgi:AAA family ATP:ADP antiporter
MTSLAARVRPGERREVAAALATAFLVMMAHAQLETARDTLFLTNLAPSKLLGLSGDRGAVGDCRILGRPGTGRSNRLSLVAMQIVAAIGTAVFILPWPSREKMFYALYIWGGLAAAVILTRFWLILGNRLTASQAKRLFPLIASGTVGGSLVGFAVGGLLAAKFGAHALLGGSAIAFVASAATATWWWYVPVSIERAGDAVPAAPAVESEQRWRNLGVAVRDGYVGRLALALLLPASA